MKLASQQYYPILGRLPCKLHRMKLMVLSDPPPFEFLFENKLTYIDIALLLRCTISSSQVQSDYWSLVTGVTWPDFGKYKC
jgi:hypothetical protein